VSGAAARYIRRLKGHDDYVVTFERTAKLKNTTNDHCVDHTGTAPFRIVIRFNWFPRDRLKRRSTSSTV
jgi:hypothetical protein